MYKQVKGSQAMGYLSTRPTMIITTLHESGIVNAGVFGSYTNLSPTQVGIAVGAGSHTYANMKRTGEFVINVPGADLVKAIAILARPIPPDRSELDEAGLTARDGVAVKTPSVAECVAAVEFAFEQEVPVGHHSFMVGAVRGGWIREEFLDADGKIDIFKARVFHDFKYPQPVYVLPGEVVQG
jgi:flavin reductase (DIM6/NTAB) family NADH-FMN oxidoreductase RutF